MAVLLDAFQEAVGSIKAWLRPNTSEGLPPNWVICDGSTIVDPDSPFNTKPVPDLRDKFVRGHPTLTNANFGADAAYEAGGTIPAGGVNSQDLTHAHAAGAHTHGIGSHSHGIFSDGGHNHTVQDHQHLQGAHQHTITVDGAHTHSVVAGNIFAALPGAALSVDGSHSHGGATQFGGSVNTGSGGAQNTSSSGGHNHTGVTTGASGTTDPGAGNTADGLGVFDNTPANLGLVMILRIK